jgi:hypothetical protein
MAATNSLPKVSVGGNNAREGLEHPAKCLWKVKEKRKQVK